MAETRTLERTHPLESRRGLLAVLTAELGGALAIELGDPVAAAGLHVDPVTGGPEAVAGVVGGPLPDRPDTWTGLPDGEALRLGPEEWLLTSAASAPEAWERLVDAAAAPHGGTAVDVSAQRTRLLLRGPLAREVLAFGCSIDLRPASFPRGRCAQTLLGQAPVLLVAGGDDPAADDLTLHVRPSFADYVVDRLVDTAQEFRPESRRDEA